MVQIGNDAAAALQQARADASLSRINFAIAAMAAGIITEAEAEAWAGQGQLPAFVAAAIATLPVGEQAAARITAAGATVIERNDALVALMAAAIPLTDAQVDALFGIV